MRKKIETRLKKLGINYEYAWNGRRKDLYLVEVLDGEEHDFWIHPTTRGLYVTSTEDGIEDQCSITFDGLMEYLESAEWV